MSKHDDRTPASGSPPSSADELLVVEHSEKNKAIDAQMEELAGKPLEEFTDVVPFDDGFDAADKILNYVRGNFSDEKWGFRGQDDAEWGLEPVIERLARAGGYPGWEDQERYARKAFKRRAHQYVRRLPGKRDELEWLALMRHHGAPTRLLDWTKSPYVGLFFAVAEQKPEKKAALWAIDREELDYAARFLLCVEDVENVHIRANVSLGTPAYFTKIFFDSKRRPLVGPVEPFGMNERLTAQQGFFLCPTQSPLSFENKLARLLEWEEEQEKKLKRPAVTRLRLHKLVIPPRARIPLLRELNRMNINSATLFPDLDGFARSLGTNVEIMTRIGPRRGWDYDRQV